MIYSMVLFPVTLSDR